MHDMKHGFSASADAEHPAPTPGESPRQPALEIFETWLDLCSDTATFAAARTHQNVLEMHELMHCRSPSMIMSVSLRYLQTAIDMYREEACRIARLQKRFDHHKAPAPRT